MIIPAHNEGTGLATAIDSVLVQGVPACDILVVSDNSTDDTVDVAEAMGAWVMETVDNTDKKAGALNQALRRILPGSTTTTTSL